LKTNFKLIIQYLGTSYNGWQYQPSSPTIQNEVELAFKKILHKNQQNINLIASGRTDSGVHALGQVANITIDTNLSEKDIKRAINANLPKDIYIRDCSIVDLDFNARFSAKKRCYIYKIDNEYSPFNNKFSWFNDNEFDINLLKKSAKLILGKHNFSLLSKSNPDITNKDCNIYFSEWTTNMNRLIYTIKGNRFLHHMVRYLVGSMIEIGKNKLSLDEFNSLLNNESKNSSIFKAPAHGLYLKKVYYE
tara:strand:+ start:509 stop:1252 length:744 start_codon:yes stop_codon:yes gene_type:complete